MSTRTNFILQYENLRLRQGLPPSLFETSLLERKRSLTTGSGELNLMAEPRKRMALAVEGTAFMSESPLAANWFASSMDAYRRNRAAELDAMIMMALQSRGTSLAGSSPANPVRQAAQANNVTSAVLQTGDQVHLNLMETRSACFPSRFSTKVAGIPQIQAHLFPTPMIRFPVLPRSLPMVSDQKERGKPGFKNISSTKVPAKVTLCKPVPKMASAVITSPSECHQGNPTKIPRMSLSGYEDPNWLSDFHGFVRKELVEICFATKNDVAFRGVNHKVFLNQMGLCCRFCCGLGAGYAEDRAPRSIAFPSSIAQIYQSFTMMVREHFGSCKSIPEDLKTKFLELKQGKTAQGAVNSKAYWEYSARALGMKDSDDGIILTKETQIAALKLPPYGSDLTTQESTPVLLVHPGERSLAKADYTFTLLEQVQRVQLLPLECKGNRKTLRSGLSGLACRHCCRVGRLGLSRTFPVKKRNIAAKMEDMFQHFMRCTLCPEMTKELLREQRATGLAVSRNEKALYDLVWERLRTGQQSNDTLAP